MDTPVKKVWPDEAALLARIAVRDEGAFRVIFDRYRKRLYTFALKVLRSETLAEEVVQETFVKIWLMGDPLKNIKNLESYLVKAARNKSIDMLRVQSRHEKLQIAGAVSEVHNETEEQVLLNDTRALIHNAIQQLPRQQRAVYELCHIEGLKYEEAAERLHISPLTVKTHMQQALKNLRTLLGNHPELALVIYILKLF